jgi:hypothetical protein
VGGLQLLIGLLVSVNESVPSCSSVDDGGGVSNLLGGQLTSISRLLLFELLNLVIVFIDTKF